MTTCHAKTLMQHHDYVIEIPYKSHNEITRQGFTPIRALMCITAVYTVRILSRVWILLLE